MPARNESSLRLEAAVNIDECAAFRQLQKRLPDQFRRIFANDRLPRTILVVPSLSLDSEVLMRISGVHHYEERPLPAAPTSDAAQSRHLYL